MNNFYIQVDLINISKSLGFPIEIKLILLVVRELNLKYDFNLCMRLVKVPCGLQFVYAFSQSSLWITICVCI